jgi:hypothetical protein
MIKNWTGTCTLKSFAMLWFPTVWSSLKVLFGILNLSEAHPCRYLTYNPHRFSLANVSSLETLNCFAVAGRPLFSAEARLPSAKNNRASTSVHSLKEEFLMLLSFSWHCSGFQSMHFHGTEWINNHSPEWMKKESFLFEVYWWIPSRRGDDARTCRERKMLHILNTED